MKGVINIRGSVTGGWLADSVQEVVDIAEDSTDPPPAVGTSFENRFIRGLGQAAGTCKLVLVSRWRNTDARVLTIGPGNDYPSAAAIACTSWRRVFWCCASSGSESDE